MSGFDSEPSVFVPTIDPDAYYETVLPISAGQICQVADAYYIEVGVTQYNHGKLHTGKVLAAIDALPRVLSAIKLSQGLVVESNRVQWETTEVHA